MPCADADPIEVQRAWSWGPGHARLWTLAPAQHTRPSSSSYYSLQDGGHQQPFIHYLARQVKPIDLSYARTVPVTAAQGETQKATPIRR